MPIAKLFAQKDWSDPVKWVMGIVSALVISLICFLAFLFWGIVAGRNSTETSETTHGVQETNTKIPEELRQQILTEFFIAGSDDVLGASIEGSRQHFQAIYIENDSIITSIQIPVNFSCGRLSPIIQLNSDIENRPAELLGQMYCDSSYEPEPMEGQSVSSSQRQWLNYIPGQPIKIQRGRYWLHLGFTDAQLGGFPIDHTFRSIWYGVRGGIYSDQKDSISSNRESGQWVVQKADKFYRVLGFVSTD